MKKVMFLAMTAASLLFVACGGNKEEAGTSSTTTEAPADNAAATEAPAAEAAVSNTISLTGNDQMKYDQTAFTVKANQPIDLTMKNVGTLPAKSMSHDVVVLKPGTDINTIGQALAQAGGDIEKLPADLKGQIIAHTKMLGPGEEDKINFTLPAAGEYPFMCSFPGHYSVMHGTITAQ